MQNWGAVALIGAMVAVLSVGCAGNTVTNRVGVDKNGAPTIELETVVVQARDDSVTFLGPEEFQIQFNEGSVFVDSEGELPGLYQTNTGELLLEVDPNKRRKLDPGVQFKYDVIVNGFVLDPYMNIK